MKFLSTLAVTASALLAMSAPANASIVFGENFDNDGTPGTSTANFNGFVKFIAPLPSGTVDLIQSGTNGINCVGGTGKCVDLDGSTNNAGALVSKTLFSFEAGDLVNLTFQLSGNQRNLDQDGWFAGFVGFNNVPLQWSDSGRDSGCGGSAGGPGSGNIFVTSTGACPTFGGDPFSQRSLTFRVATAGDALLVIGDPNSGGDNIGAILDNVFVSAGNRNAVPEPATWAMMILGFGLVGGAMRRKRQVTVAYA